MFWVRQKDRYLRQLLIRDIEDRTKRRLVVHYANRFTRGAEIRSGDLAHFVELLSDVGNAPTDLLLETPGGETDTTEAIISFLRRALPDLRVIVPGSAKSNGTLIALSASIILMGKASDLGPIEPSLQGIPCSTLTLPEVRANNLVLSVSATHALRQTQELALRLLTSGMMATAKEDAIQATVGALSTRDTYPSHGSVIDRDEARAIGLQIANLEDDETLANQIWLLACMYDFDLRRDGLSKAYEGARTSLLLTAPPEPVPV